MALNEAGLVAHSLLGEVNHDGLKSALLSSLSDQDLQDEIDKHNNPRHKLWIFHTAFSCQEDFEAHLQHLETLDDCIGSGTVGNTKFCGMIVMKGAVAFKAPEKKEDVVSILSSTNTVAVEPTFKGAQHHLTYPCFEGVTELEFNASRKRQRND